MRSAPCPSCGGQVMPYRSYMFYMRPSATCQQCQARVTMGGFFWASVVGGLAVLGLMIYSLETGRGWLLVALLALVAVLDLVWYRFVPWRPVEPSAPREVTRP